MRWGVFDQTDDVHVAPCNDDGDILGGHALLRECWCSPEVLTLDDMRGKKPIIVHYPDE